MKKYGVVEWISIKSETVIVSRLLIILRALGFPLEPNSNFLVAWEYLDAHPTIATAFNYGSLLLRGRSGRDALIQEANGGPVVGPVKVEFTRDVPTNPRPTGVIVEYTIDGVTNRIPFKNQSGR